MPANDLHLSAGLLDNLTVSVSLVNRKDRFFGWNRTNIAHADHHLYYIADGEGKVILNGQTYYPRPGQLMIMPGGAAQTTETSRERPYFRYFCHFGATIGEWPLFPPDGRMLLADADDPERIQHEFDGMVEQFQDGGYLAPLKLKSSLLKLLAFCMERSGYAEDLRVIMDQGERSKLGSVLQYIEGNLGSRIEIETLADLVHLHPNYFIPYFKKVMGDTPMHYVQQKRMDRAKRLLSFSDISISDTAEQLGMDLAHFSRTFKKTTGVSPSAYRSGTK